MWQVSASTFASKVDFVFWFIVAVSFFFLVLITALMIGFAVKYRRGKRERGEDIHGSLPLEIIWTVIPTILVMMMFWYGWDGFKAMREVPEEAMPIEVTGQMWAWSFQYPNGKTSSELYVPLGKPMRMNLHSPDVLHSFFIPAFRLKEDVVPGKNNYMWFEATALGTYDILCAEYCGQRHSYMLSKVHVLPEAEFSAWLDKRDEDAGAPEGLRLLKAKGCLGCHTTDGTPRVGPSFKGLYGREEVVLSGGVEKTIIEDEAYIRRALLQPTADVVKGFPPIMPSQAGVLSDAEIDAIIAYLKDLK